MKRYFFLIFFTISVVMVAMDQQEECNNELALEVSDISQDDQKECDPAFHVNQELFFSIHNYAIQGSSDLTQIQYCLDKNANVNARFLHKGDTPLDWAIWGVKNNCLLRLLLKHKADPCQKSALKEGLNHFEAFLMNQNKVYSEEIIRLFLDNKADPCKLIPSHITFPYEHVIQLKSERPMLLDAMLEKIFPLSCKKMVTTFLLCMKTAKKPLLHDTKLTLKYYQVPPRGVQYLILKIAPIIKALDAFKHIAQKDEPSEYEVKEFKNVLLSVIKRYPSNDLLC